MTAGCPASGLLATQGNTYPHCRGRFLLFSSLELKSFLLIGGKNCFNSGRISCEIKVGGWAWTRGPGPQGKRSSPGQQSRTRRRDEGGCVRLSARVPRGEEGPGPPRSALRRPRWRKGMGPTGRAGTRCREEARRGRRPRASGRLSASARLFPSGLPACSQGGPDLGRGPCRAGVLILSGALLSSLSPGPDSVPPARHEVCPALPQEAGPGLGDTLHLKLVTSQPGPFPVVPAANTLSLWVRPPPPQPPKHHSS